MEIIICIYIYEMWSAVRPIKTDFVRYTGEHSFAFSHSKEINEEKTGKSESDRVSERVKKRLWRFWRRLLYSSKMRFPSKISIFYSFGRMNWTVNTWYRLFVSLCSEFFLSIALFLEHRSILTSLNIFNRFKRLRHL